MPIEIPEVARRTTPVDLDQNVSYMPNLSCPLVAAETVEDDRVIIETVTDGGERALRFQFESEVGGPFGVRNPLADFLASWGDIRNDTYQSFQALADAFDALHLYAPYAVYLNESGEIYLKATPVSMFGTDPLQDDMAVLSVGDATELRRMAAILLGAISCHGYSEREGALVQWAQEMNGRIDALTTKGSDLPLEQHVKSQVKQP